MSTRNATYWGDNYETRKDELEDFDQLEDFARRDIELAGLVSNRSF